MTDKKPLAAVLARLRDELELRDAPRWITELDPSKTPTDAQLDALIRWSARIPVDNERRKRRQARVLARLRELRKR